MPARRDHEPIQVAIRARPLNNDEKARGSEIGLSVHKNYNEITLPDKQNPANKRTYAFDKVFDWKTRQFELYQEVIVPIVEDVIAGYNATVFAYGQTGSGKTYTMEGERSKDKNIAWDEDPQSGLIPRVLHHLFATLPSRATDSSITVSFMQLYNEDITDLLSKGDDMPKLRLFEDPDKKGSVKVENLEEVVIQTNHQVYDVLKKGSDRRATAATLMNAKSSRSHTVFSISVKITETEWNGDDLEEVIRVGKLNLVDLAGSENIGRSGAVDQRAREAGQINQSLLALRRVITALVDKSPHIPYRDSKLTRILQDSLGGNTKACIIATISPSTLYLEETQRTLEFAISAKDVSNRPEINQVRRSMTLMPMAPLTPVFFDPPPLNLELLDPSHEDVLGKLIEHYELQSEKRRKHVGDAERRYNEMEELLRKMTNSGKTMHQARDEERKARVLAERQLLGERHRCSTLARENADLAGRLEKYEANCRAAFNQGEEARLRQAALKNALDGKEKTLQQLRSIVGVSGFANTPVRKTSSQESLSGKSGGRSVRNRPPTPNNIASPSPRVAGTGGNSVYPMLTIAPDNLPLSHRNGGLVPGSATRSSKQRRAPSPPPKPSRSVCQAAARRHRRSKSVGGQGQGSFKRGSDEDCSDSSANKRLRT